ncbi:MAG: aerobic respiration control sensor protein ArcB [Syntrophorhabdaceae bacterium PtaU1.Bin034]|jgi:PAS domain S-box-containing protein|nr:MAG: aerobic respiration control sensor protein ArcB [Syntrophorhabdaceae bacterium PtaU1.Bin034]
MKEKDGPQNASERKDPLEKLRESEIKYRTLFDNANDGIFLMRGEVFVDCNQKFLTIFRCSREQIIGQTPYRFSPPFQPDGRISKEKAIERGKAAFYERPQFFEWRHCRLDGSVFDAEVSLNKIEIDKNTRLLQAIVRDITERKEAENKLRASEERYRTFIDSTSDGVFLKDARFRYIIVNKRLGAYFKKKGEEIIGKTDYDIMPRENAEKARKADIRAVDSSSVLVWEETVADKIYEIRKFAVSLGESGKGLGGFVRDITARRKAEEELKIKSINLEEVNSALKVLLRQREQDKDEMEGRILDNVKKLVLPYIERLKEKRLEEEQRTYLDILETNLKNIISPFVQKMTSAYSNFTRTEILVANLIRDGKTIKEVAKISGVSENAINRHRQNIRNKLGLNKQKINLKAYLMQLN